MPHSLYTVINGVRKVRFIVMVNYLSKTRSDNTSGRKGVTISKSGKFIAKINFNGERISLGIYDNIDDAIKIREYAEELIRVLYC